MNLTDVDDKIIKRAPRAGEDDHAGHRAGHRASFTRTGYLRIEDAEVYPKATDCIPEMIALVERLIERGVAYQAEDGSVYFAIASFPAYGKLSRLDTREIKSGARVAQDDYAKENAQDFALWKAAKPEDEASGAAWDSPWGRGRPGWHLECSAMAMRCSARRSTSTAAASISSSRITRTRSRSPRRRRGRRSRASGATAQFLLTDGAKMAKRVGNVATVAGPARAGRLGAPRSGTSCSRRTIASSSTSSDEALEASIEAVRRDRRFRASGSRRRRGGTAELATAADELERRRDGGAVRRSERAGGDGGAVQFHPARRTRSSTRGAATSRRWSGRGRRSRWMNGVLDIVPERESGGRRARGVGRRSGWRRGRRRGRGAILRAADAIRAELDVSAASRSRTDAQGDPVEEGCQ